MVGSTWPQTENRPIANRAGISHHFQAYLGMFQECQRGRKNLKIAKNRRKPQKTSFFSRVHRSISDLDPDKKNYGSAKMASHKKKIQHVFFNRYQFLAYFFFVGPRKSALTFAKRNFFSPKVEKSKKSKVYYPQKSLEPIWSTPAKNTTGDFRIFI